MRKKLAIAATILVMLAIAPWAYSARCTMLQCPPRPEGPCGITGKYCPPSWGWPR